MLARRVTLKKRQYLPSFIRACRVLPPQGSAASGGNRLPGRFREVEDAAGGRFMSFSSSNRPAGAGSIRAFGGQSVVPWELALFLVEEVGFIGGVPHFA